MSGRDAKVHVFTNGAALVEVEADLTQREYSDLREAWAYLGTSRLPPMVVLPGWRLTVIEHTVPLGPARPEPPTDFGEQVVLENWK